MPVRVIAGDCRTALQELPSESVHCIVTSPPYYGLRDYGTATWDGGDPACDHMEAAVGISSKNTLGRSGHLPETNAANVGRKLQFRSVCTKCGARRIDQQIGLEQTPDAYVAELVSVFREAKRVLRKDGTLWLSIGDSYAGSWGNQGRKDTRGTQRPINGAMIQSVLDDRYPSNGSGTGRIPQGSGLKPKDLIGIPWMVAFALRADGWYLRQDNIWHKRSCMPESVTDRTTRSHEYVFMFSKSQRYFYDAVAVSEPSVIGAGAVRNLTARNKGQASTRNDGDRLGLVNDGFRNRRSVWTIATEPSGIAHYAMMPTALAEICIKAGTSEKGCCPHCGAGWVRQVERTTASVLSPRSGYGHGASRRDGGRSKLVGAKTETLGWQPSCTCPEHDPVPATVLDFFAGAGTTGLVADRLGRSAILIELSETNAAMARNRLEGDAGLFAEVSAG